MLPREPLRSHSATARWPPRPAQHPRTATLQRQSEPERTPRRANCAFSCLLQNEKGAYAPKSKKRAWVRPLLGTALLSVGIITTMRSRLSSEPERTRYVSSPHRTVAIDIVDDQLGVQRRDLDPLSLHRNARGP